MPLYGLACLRDTRSGQSGGRIGVRFDALQARTWIPLVWGFSCQVGCPQPDPRSWLAETAFAITSRAVAKEIEPACTDILFAANQRAVPPAHAVPRQVWTKPRTEVPLSARLLSPFKGTGGRRALAITGSHRFVPCQTVPAWQSSRGYTGRKDGHFDAIASFPAFVARRRHRRPRLRDPDRSRRRCRNPAQHATRLARRR